MLSPSARRRESSIESVVAPDSRSNRVTKRTGKSLVKVGYTTVSWLSMNVSDDPSTGRSALQMAPPSRCRWMNERPSPPPIATAPVPAMRA